MPGNLNLEVIIGLVDRLTGPLRGMRAELERKLATTANLTFIGDALRRTGEQALGPLRQTVLEAGALGSTLTEVGIVAEVTRERLGAVRPELRALAEQTNQYTTDLAAGLKDLTARGMGFDAALAVMPGIAQATTAAKAAMLDMTGLSSALVQNLEITPSTAGITRALGMLIQAGNEGQFELNSMAQYFPLLTGGMRNVGLVGEDAVATVGAALQVVRQATGEDSQAANYMANLLSKMTAPITVKNMEKLWGVDLVGQFRQWQDQGLNVFDEFIALVRARTQGDPFALSEVFQDMEVLGALKPLLANMERLEAIRAKALGAADTAGGLQFDRRLTEDATESWRALGIVLANLRDQVGESLLPALRALTQGLRETLAPIGDWIMRHPRLTGGILTTVAAGSALMVVLGGLLTGLAGVVGAVALLGFSLSGALAPLGWLVRGAGMAGRAVLLLGLGLRSLGPLLLMLGRLLLLTPLGWLVATIGAAIYVFTHWEETVEAASRAYGRLVQWLGVDVIGAVLSGWRVFTDWLSSTFGPALAAAGRAYDGLSSAAAQAVDAVRERFAGLLSWLQGLPAQMLALAGRVGQSLVDGLIAPLQAGWGKVRAAASKLTGGLIGASREEADAHSPSRAMIALGTDLVRGLEIGIAARERFAQGAMRGLAAGLTLGGASLALPVQALPVQLHEITALPAPALPAPQVGVPTRAAEAAKAVEAAKMVETAMAGKAAAALDASKTIESAAALEAAKTLEAAKAVEAASRAMAQVMDQEAAKAVEAVRGRFTALLTWLQGLPGQFEAAGKAIGQALVTGLPALQLGLPEVPALPALQVKLPEVPALPALQLELPEVPALPALQVKLPEVPALPALQLELPEVPELAQTPPQAAPLTLTQMVAPEPGAAPTAVPGPRRSAPAKVEMPITVNITAPPGADTRELAALVRREVAQATSHAAGRIARLYDTSDGL